MTSRKRNVGLKDIAARMGVSVTTVARALKGSPLTNPKTAEKVSAVAREMGYVRNLDGVRLRTGQSFVVAAVLKFPTDSEVGDPTLLGLLQGIHDRCSETDYSVKAIVSSSVEEEIMALEEIIRTRSADAVVLDYTVPKDARVKLLLDAEMPFVTFGRTELSTPHPYMDIDNEYAAWQGTKALIGRGCHRIAMLDGEAHLSYVQQRLKGYRRALREDGLPFDPTLISHFEPSAHFARIQARKFCDGSNIDAMLCVSDVVLIGAQAGARDCRPGLENEVKFAVRGGTNLGQYLGNVPDVSYYSRVEAGWHLGDLVLRRLRGEDVQTLQRIEKTILR